MRLLAMVHEAAAGPGVFADVFRARGVEVDEWFVPAAGEAPAVGAVRARYEGVISLGGAMNADQEAAHPWLRDEKALLAELVTRDVPVLGVCLGAQLLADAIGGAARPASRPEVGWFDVSVSAAGSEDPLLGPLAPRFEALEWHSYEFALPPEAVPLASSATCLQAYRVGRAAWGIQFHAEVTLDDFESWIDSERSPEEIARLGFSPERLRARTRDAISGWNRIGHGICERFLDVVRA